MDPAKRRQQELVERRKMRIREVRSQEKLFASKIRDDYQQRLARERDVISAHLRCQHLSEQEKKQQAAELAYQQLLKDFGKSHNLALHTNIEQANDNRVSKLLDARKRAEERHAIALQNVRQNLLYYMISLSCINSRCLAIMVAPRSKETIQTE
jgi:hypothetical protein